MTAIAAVDMFVVATATFKLLDAVIVLNRQRRRVTHFDVTQNALIANVQDFPVTSTASLTEDELTKWYVMLAVKAKELKLLNHVVVG
jgi:hypothetical protein